MPASIVAGMVGSASFLYRASSTDNRVLRGGKVGNAASIGAFNPLTVKDATYILRLYVKACDQIARSVHYSGGVVLP